MPLSFGNVFNTDVTYAESSGTATSLNVTLPSLSAGDLIVLIAFSDSSTSYPTCSGYTASSIAADTNGCIDVFQKTAIGSETTATISLSGIAAYIQCIAMVMSGHNPTTPINAITASTAGGGSNWNSPTITTTADGCLLFFCGGARDVSDFVANDEPNTSTLVYQDASGSSWLGVAYESQTSAGATGTRLWENAVNAKRTLSFAIAPATGPTITNTSDDTPTDGTTLTITGTSFGTQTGSAGVTVGGVSVTPSNWAASQIQIPLTIGANKYGVNVPIVVTDSGGVSSSAYNVQIQPASGVNYVNLSGTLASSGDRITATPDLASGDQVEWSNVVGGTISDVTVNADASFVASSGVISFDVRVNDGTGWGTYATQLLVAGRGIVRPLVRSLTSNLVTNLVG